MGIKNRQLIPYTHKELVERGYKYLEKYCGFVLKEFKTYSVEIPDVIGFRHEKTILIECKTSRADYFNDCKKEHRNFVHKLGNHRFYLVPDGMISKDELFEGWGLLYCTPKQIRHIVDAPYHNPVETRIEEYHILYSLCRRANLHGFMPELTEKTTPIEKQ
jgi:hypothetical protein